MVFKHDESIIFPINW